MTEECYTVIRNSFSMEICDEQLKEETESCYSEQVKEEVLELSKQKKYIPFVARHLMQLGIDRDFWAQQYHFYLKRNKVILAFIAEIFEEFFQQSIKTVFVYENFGGLLSSGSDLALYSSGDVDLCADRSEFDKINAIMLKRGFRLKKEKDSLHSIFRVGYKGKIGDMDYRINLMFKPLVRYRMPVHVNDEIISAKFMRYYQDTRIRIPTQEVLLYLNMMRISVHGYVRSPDIRLYIDIYNCSRGQTDWEQVVAWAKRDGNMTRIVVVAYLANCLFGTLVPQWLLDMKDDKALKAGALISIICDTENKRLKCTPSRKERRLIEFYSDNNSFVQGALQVLFPNKEWLMTFYGKEGKGLLYGYARYLRFIAGGV